ncbi:hypothetical protein [Methanobacterium spitsbergense]|uniref:Uncharacterized protein n=1 Tax=Methanobacterium spitsbergense TaxID=2874285 RepID=A0A8T5UQT2_9EURY|nr:hypothetical protein [Methanobacterium spitsbergense]MBZ2166342.1 hypothetical protein [Methanobacterium spitsbergense]
MEDYTWIKNKSEGLYYAEVQELIQIIDWTLAWKQLKEAFLPYFELWNKAINQVVENLKSNPQFINFANDYMRNKDLCPNKFKGYSIAGQTRTSFEPLYKKQKESKDKGLTQRKYLELTKGR